MADFDIAYHLTSQAEGGYANVPGDYGGETYCGISRKNWPHWQGWKIIDEVKKTRQIRHNEVLPLPNLNRLVKEFYEINFWNYNRLSEINSQDIANEVYDTGVNMGPRTAASILQEAINLLNRDEKDYLDIEEDGILGGETIGAVNNHKKLRALLKTLNGIQFSEYRAICKRNKKQEKFFYGWLNRT